MTTGEVEIVRTGESFGRNLQQLLADIGRQVVMRTRLVLEEGNQYKLALRNVDGDVIVRAPMPLALLGFVVLLRMAPQRLRTMLWILNLFGRFHASVEYEGTHQSDAQ